MFVKFRHATNDHRAVDDVVAEPKINGGDVQVGLGLVGQVERLKGHARLVTYPAGQPT